MSIHGYKIRDKEGIHFITFAVIGWVDIFTRKDYCTILIDSIRHCQKEKGLLLYAWCLMSNHIHMVVSAKNNDTSDILRDFKKFTSKRIFKAILEHRGESRKKWMLEIFRQAGEKNSRNTNFQFWQQDNHPIQLVTPSFSRQKIDYIHNNPVKAGIVDKAEDYRYSSARDYAEGRQCGLIEVEFLLS